MRSIPPQAATPPVRIQQNILARGERRLLNFSCPRLPGWITPDQLTTLGFLGAVMVAMGYMLSWLGPAWLWLSAPTPAPATPPSNWRAGPTS